MGWNRKLAKRLPMPHSPLGPLPFGTTRPPQRPHTLPMELFSNDTRKLVVAQFSNKFGCCPSCIAFIVLGISWMRELTSWADTVHYLFLLKRSMIYFGSLSFIMLKCDQIWRNFATFAIFRVNLLFGKVLNLFLINIYDNMQIFIVQNGQTL